MPFLHTRAGNVHYTDTGTGHPVVLLHATLHDSHDFDEIIPTLQESYRVIAIDWPSHGKSDKSNTPPTAPLFADVLEDMVKELDLPPATFIGNSVGGFAAARLAITNPDKVASLILVNAGGFIPWTTTSRTFTRALGNKLINRALMPTLVTRYMSPTTDLDKRITQEVRARAKTRQGAQTAASIWKSFPTPDHDLRPRAANLTAPTLLIWGKKDPIIPLKAGEETKKQLTQATLKTLNTGHIPFATTPKDFLALAKPFITSTSKKPSNPNQA
jgi:pimeloyl-ACP methyl ester carboxylesterase